MKKYFSLFLLCLSAIFLWAQSNNNEDEVVKIDRFNQRAFRPDEVIVKFKDDGAVQMRAPQRAKFASTQVSAVDRLFLTLGVDSVEELMPMTGSKMLPKRIKAYNGQDIEPKNLGKLYRLKLSSQAMQQRSVFQVIDTLRTLEEVDYAEPNYLVYALSSGEGDSATYCSEPLYSQQWGPAAIGLPYLWKQPKVRTKRPVIAILDTGVDIEHPDLADNIWTNEGEAEGATDQDDDGNGFKDDLHGWDFINQRGHIADYNGHGTHCAGIAAAVGNNGIGIAGANPDALIMPVVVMQADGSGDVATIIKGIDYAAVNGADVISMSFGSYGYSIAEEQALGRAYATSVLVAAAGNDGHDIIGYHCAGDAPMFPAAFTFVLGVEASNDRAGMRPSFSNYDEDGPIYSGFEEEKLYNYELRAPGQNILSTFPGGRYKSLNGTSMACPLVAGAISRLLQAKTDSALVSKEVLFGDLIHSRPNLSGNINMQTVYNYSDANRTPTLWLVGQQVKDTIVGDGDGEYDAGETIAFYPILRNDWGMAKNIRFWMRTGQYNGGDWVIGDTAQIHYLTDTVSFGKSLSSYAKNTAVNPICFSINPNCNDGVKIPLTFFAVCEGMQDTLRHTITIQVTNGVEIGGMITEDLTLYPKVHYIITRQLAVPEGVTLTLEPGTILKFKDGTGLSVGEGGHICAHGKPDSMIVFTKAEHGGGVISGINFFCEDTLRYCKFEQLVYGGDMWFSTCMGLYENCIMNNIYSSGAGLVNSGAFIKSNIFSYAGMFFTHYSTMFHVTNLHNLKEVNICNNIASVLDVFYESAELYGYNNVFNNSYSFRDWNVNAPTVINTPQYWGSNREDIIRRKEVWDMNNSLGYCHYDLSTRLTRPNPLAHGIVWKVVINGYDAQDEFEQLPPLGVGTHKCEVYFNRAMDTLITPYIAYGVRPPYTQHAINRNGTWSADSTIYTAYFTIDAKTVSDGLNRIYVADAQDNEHFEIPLEDMRFNMQIEAAGSLATGLMAEAGLGKVTLTWETDEEDFEDLLGYNIYRWTEDTIRWDEYWDYDENGNWTHFPAGWRIDTIQVNQTLIDSEETMFVDYDVVPGKAYYYVIKQITTSLNQYALSNPVVATPLTAQKGDANGSLSVDVADVVTEISYLTGGNPQPFIFEAADVNSDGVVNILDIVGTINIITHPEVSSLGFSDENTATYTIEDGILYVETPVVLGGVQFTLQAPQGTTFEVLDALKPFEQVGQWTDEDSYLFMAYSMSGKTLGIGKHALMRIGDAAVENIVLSNTQGQNVPAISGQVTAISTSESMQMRLPNPNPFSDAVTIPFVVGKVGTHSVQLCFTNVAGLTVDTYTATLPFGEHTYTWHAASMPAGVYFVTLYVDGKKIQNNKLIHIQ